jgi:CubicO group peptidase (beta-lactamase class C family)
MMHSVLQAQELDRESELQALDAKIQSIIKAHNIPSVAYAIMKDGEPAHISVMGMADKESATRAALTTQYRIASTSKMVVAIAVMQLVESGQLSLDDKVSQLLPGFEFSNKWAETHPLRLAHLLESTAGWDEISLKEFAYNNNPPLDLVTSLAVNPKNRTSRWPPGTRHAYTNSAAAVAALVVENKTGKSFYSYAEQHIFKPLGIQSATYSEANKHGATGYKNGQPVAHKVLLMRPAGGLSLNIEDMAKLTQFYISRGQGLLSEETVERMEHANTTNVAPFSAGYGQFNYSRFYDGIRYRGHEGDLPGWSSELSYSPKHKVGFVVLQNSERSLGFRAVVDVITQYLAKGFTPATILARDIPQKWVAKSGYYRYQNPRISKRFFLERLISAHKFEVMSDKAVFSRVFPSGWKREITYQGEDTWQNDKGESVMKLGKDPVLGTVLHFGSRVFEPVSAFNAWIDKILLIVWLIMLLSMMIYSMIWPVKFWRGKLIEPGDLRFRLSTSAAVWSVVLFILFFGLGFASPIGRFGNIGMFSLGLFITSLILPVATAWAGYNLVDMRKILGQTFLYRCSLAYIAVQALVVTYLANFGVIGILSWT